MPKKPSLAERIRRLDGKIPRAQIARELGTSPDYVRVVLNHRIKPGGVSKYDIAYTKKIGDRHRMHNTHRAYHAVSKPDRRQIWQETRRDVVASHGTLSDPELKRLVSTTAIQRIRKRGRQLLSLARDVSTVSDGINMVSNP